MNDLITLDDGRRVWTSTFTGSVIDVKKLAETWANSNSAADCTVENTHVDSDHLIGKSQIHGHKLWLRATSGEERFFILSTKSIQYRKGEILSITWGAIEGYDSGEIFQVKQHSTDRVISLTNFGICAEAGLIEKLNWFQFIIGFALLLSIFGIPLLITLAAIKYLMYKKLARSFDNKLHRLIDITRSKDISAEAATVI